MDYSPPDFLTLGVPQPVVDALVSAGITAPFPIQEASIPDGLAGRDVLGRAETGSGKTVAFGAPLVTRLNAAQSQTQPGRPRGLVLAPTRELASQVARTLTVMAQALGLSVATAYGGVDQKPQVRALRGAADILVATPGRLEDLINQGHASLGDVEITVLDEADHMADLGFLPAVTRLLNMTPRTGQRLLFSATLDKEVDVLVRRYLTDPVEHTVEEVLVPPPPMMHRFVHVERKDKPAVVRELASGQGRTLMFTRTRNDARRLAESLTKAGIPALELHGDLMQSARERNLKAFADGDIRVLVATDVAARGLHIDDVSLVVHVDPPEDPKAFLHRSGRTARAGAAGAVVTIVTMDQAGQARALAQAAGIQPTRVFVEPGDVRVRDIVGPPLSGSTGAPRKGASGAGQPDAETGGTEAGAEATGGLPTAGEQPKANPHRRRRRRRTYSGTPQKTG